MVSFSVSGKVAIVTGGSMGLGEGLVKELVRQDAKHVAIFDIAMEKGKTLENAIIKKYGKDKVKYITCDVSDKEHLSAAYKQVMETFKRIDIVFNNAGIFDEMTFEKMIAVNVTGVISSTLLAMDIMRGSGGGVIVNTSSVAAIIDSHLFPIYSATKAAILTFSNCLGLEPMYEQSKVRVIAVLPGGTDTSMTSMEAMSCSSPQNKEAIEELLRTTRRQSVEDAAEAIMLAVETGASGSSWVINDGKAQDVTSLVKGNKMNIDVLSK